MKLNDKQIAILSQAASHRDGVVSFRGAGTGVGFQRRAWEAQVAHLLSADFLTPSPFNDFYITDAGRRALSERSSK